MKINSISKNQSFGALMLEKKEIKVSPEMLHHFSRNMRATPADFGIIRITVGAWRSIADLLEAAAEKLEANNERP